MRNPFFPLSDNVFAGGTKSARGGPNPLADFVRGTISASGFGPGRTKTAGGPIPL